MSPATRTRIVALLFLLSSGVPTLTAQEADNATRLRASTFGRGFWEMVP